MEIIFYDVRTRTKVAIPVEKVEKYRIVRRSGGKDAQIRYAVKASHKGSTVTRFISKEEFEVLAAPTAADKISEKS
jgi:hypothetical protein